MKITIVTFSNGFVGKNDFVKPDWKNILNSFFFQCWNLKGFPQTLKLNNLDPDCQKSSFSMILETWDIRYP